jgi:hypothetical protein
MIEMRQALVPRSRTGTGSLWEAASEVGGIRYTARSRHGAPMALARVLVDAGISDQPVEVRSEVYDGETLRTEALRGCVRYRSLRALSRLTFVEGNEPLRVRVYRPYPEDLSLADGTPEKCVSSDRVDREPMPPSTAPDTAPSGRGTHIEVLAKGPALRRCEMCGADFVPAREWQLFCRSSCRLRAHRLGLDVGVEARAQARPAAAAEWSTCR